MFTKGRYIPPSLALFVTFAIYTRAVILRQITLIKFYDKLYRYPSYFIRDSSVSFQAQYHAVL